MARDAVPAQGARGVQLLRAGLYEEAEAVFRSALRHAPRDPGLLIYLGEALLRAGRAAEAVPHFRRLLRKHPDWAGLHANLAAVLVQTGELDEALKSARRAVALEPGSALAQCNLGLALFAQGALDDAEEAYRRSVELDPRYREGNYNLSLALLRRGRFAEGWALYRHRSERPPIAWDETMRGRTFLLRGEQGVGDQLFFLRFAPLLKARGAGALAVEVDARLDSMLGRTGLFSPVSGGPVPVMLGDLPALTGATHAPPPLVLEPAAPALESVRAQLARLGPPPYLGITWRAGIAGMARAIAKEVPLDRLAGALSTVPGTVVALQRHPAPKELADFSRMLGRPVHDLSDANEDLERMLALLHVLDEYVGVSNTNMHLRAAAGRTGRVLASIPREWRWMAAGSESPWFPGFRVYRQERGAGWASALRDLARDLR